MSRRQPRDAVPLIARKARTTEDDVWYRLYCLLRGLATRLEPESLLRKRRPLPLRSRAADGAHVSGLISTAESVEQRR